MHQPELGTISKVKTQTQTLYYGLQVSQLISTVIKLMPLSHDFKIHSSILVFTHCFSSTSFLNNFKNISVNLPVHLRNELYYFLKVSFTYAFEKQSEREKEREGEKKVERERYCSSIC